MSWIDTFFLSNGRTPLDMVRERLEATPALPQGENEDRRLTTKLRHLLNSLTLLTYDILLQNI